MQCGDDAYARRVYAVNADAEVNMSEITIDEGTGSYAPTAAFFAAGCFSCSSSVAESSSLRVREMRGGVCAAHGSGELG